MSQGVRSAPGAQPGEAVAPTLGVTPIVPASGEIERVHTALATAAQLSVDDMLVAVTSAVHEFVGAAPQSDDITCLVVRYLGDRMQFAPRIDVESEAVRS